MQDKEFHSTHQEMKTSCFVYSSALFSAGSFASEIATASELGSRNHIVSNLNQNHEFLHLDSGFARYSFVKRDGDDLTSIVDALKAKLTELKLAHVFKEDYFEYILQVGREKEFQKKVGVLRLTSQLEELSRSSVAYKGKVRFDNSPATKRNSGEDFTSLIASPDGHKMITIISGYSDWLPPDQDLCALCDAMLTMTENIFNDAEERRVFPAQLMLQVAWDELDFEDPAPGCFSALCAMILPKREITVSNMGSAWMGLFRNGKLIHSTHGTLREDGAPHQLCVSTERLRQLCLDYVREVSENYEWEAKSGDIVLAVSHGVRQVLTPEQMFASMKTIEELGLYAYIPDDTGEYGLRAMGIVKAAQVASNGPQQGDMTAVVVEV
ncbi:hypothetical protein METSCH_C06560 [Metschnikowia aff. pulcherrima]|uniref:Uncharacterized protein n=1 Tax=Metschnikowia aff. pulcherrima TaxID=2163413 RepID=A0A4P6XRF2_9ASCO|nr:hypothetical protein METSCH_C06560 [Metschnikowia aff. pulcherrima]